MKVLLIPAIILFLISQDCYSQKIDSTNSGNDSVVTKKKMSVTKKTDKKKKKKKEESFMDKVQKIIEIRKSFDVAGEVTKPALMSLKKDNDEKSTFSIDMAVAYKGFRYEKTGFTPSVQFDYSSKEKDRLERLKLGLDMYYTLYEYSGGSGKLQPYVQFSKDFFSKTEDFKFNVSFVPSFPKFFFPVRNVSGIKFKYDGTDNRWVIGLNPIVGATYERTYGGTNNINQTNYYSLTAAGMTFKRYYFQIDIFGKYEKEFIKEHNIRYKYETTASFYLDEKERSSINFAYSQEEKDIKKLYKKFTLGFGIKL